MISSLGISSYQANLTNEEFLTTSFVLLKRKLIKIYELTQEIQSIEILKARFEKTSEVLEALRLMNLSLDFTSKDAIELSNYYINLQKLIFEGNNSNPKILLKLIESL
jgi:hypothetical protein